MFSFFFIFSFAETFILNNVTIGKCTFGAKFLTKKKIASITSVFFCDEDIIEIPKFLKINDIEYTIRSFSSKAFYSSTLKHIILPPSILSIHCFCFSKSMIKHLEFSRSNIENIRHNAFSDCRSLTRIDLSSTKITKISKYLFNSCYGLQTVILPNSLTEICEGAFQNTAITQFIFPRNTEIIGAKAFMGCIKLQKINLTETKTKIIHKFAFANCPSLKRFVFSSSLEKIGKFAFNGTNIRRFNLPKTIKSIGPSALSSLNLSKIVIPEENKLFNVNGSILFTKNYSTILSWPSMENVTINIPETTEKLDYGSFIYSQAHKIELPSSLKEISNYCFAFSQIESINFPENITKLGNYSFFGCKQLKDINLSLTNIKTIPKKCFANCSNLETIILPIYLETIEYKAFFSTKIKQLELPQYVSKIGIGFLAKCENLQTISVHSLNQNFKSYNNGLYTYNYERFIVCPYGIQQNVYHLVNRTKKISPYAFSFSTFDTVHFSSKIERIEPFAFYNSFITSLWYPPSIISIGNHAFQYCEFLEYADFTTTNLTSIGAKAYEFCTKLTDISLPACLEYVGKRAFGDCHILKYVTYFGTKELRGERVFENCRNKPEAHVTKRFPFSTLAGVRVKAGTLSSS